MKFSFFWKKNELDEKNDDLSYFLLHASEEEKQRVFIEAANRSNKDQQDVVELSKKPQAA